VSYAFTRAFRAVPCDGEQSALGARDARYEQRREGLSSPATTLRSSVVVQPMPCIADAPMWTGWPMKPEIPAKLRATTEIGDPACLRLP
jgi:hypothetical protein